MMTEVQKSGPCVIPSSPNAKFILPGQIFGGFLSRKGDVLRRLSHHKRGTEL